MSLKTTILGAVADRDPGRLLAAVLQRVEAEVGELGHVLVGATRRRTPRRRPAAAGRWGRDHRSGGHQA